MPDGKQFAFKRFLELGLSCFEQTVGKREHYVFPFVVGSLCGQLCVLYSVAQSG